MKADVEEVRVGRPRRWPILNISSRLTSGPAGTASWLDVALKVLCRIKRKARRTSFLPVQRAGPKGVTNRTFERGPIPASDIRCCPIGAFQKRHERRLRIAPLALGEIGADPISKGANAQVNEFRILILDGREELNNCGPNF